MGQAPHKLQVRALLGKTFTAQKRSVTSNGFLLIGPIIFCVLLFVLQRVTNQLLDTNEDLKCACRCTKCCRDVRMGGRGWQRVCTSLDSGYCDRARGFTCEETDPTQCGVKYSSTIQAIWCPVPEPSTWPPVVWAPRPRYFAMPYGPWKSLPLLYTSDAQGFPTTNPATITGSPAGDAAAEAGSPAPPTSNQTLAARAASQMLNGPEDSIRLLGADPRKLQEIMGGLVTANGTVFNGHLLSLLGLTFSNARRPPSQYYIDSAFVNSGTDDELDTLMVLLPDKTCSSRNMTFTGGDGRNATTYNLIEFLVRLYRPIIPNIELLLQAAGVLPSNATAGANATATPGGGTAASNNPLLTSVKVACVDAPTVWAPSDAAVDSTLYCGWQRGYPQPGAQCYKATMPNNGWGTTESYALSMNWAKPSTPAGLALEITYNITWPGTSITDRNQRLPALVNMGVRGWMEANLPRGAGDGNELLGLASYPKPTDKLRLDFSSLLGPLFYCWTAQLLLPTMLQQLVYEKEKRLRMMMKMHGLGDAVYWLVTYLWYLLLYCVYMGIFLLVGSALGLKFFLKNSYAIQVLFLFLFGQTQLAFTFLLSSLFRSTRTAVVVAYLYVLTTGLMGYLLLDPLMDYDKWWLVLVELVPSFALYRGLYELGAYAFLGVYRNEFGMQWGNLYDQGNGMVTAWIILAVQWPVFMILAWYLEQVIPTGNGVPRHLLFFLKPIARRLGCLKHTNRAPHPTPSSFDPHGDSHDNLGKGAPLGTPLASLVSTGPLSPGALGPSGGSGRPLISHGAARSATTSAAAPVSEAFVTAGDGDAAGAAGAVAAAAGIVGPGVAAATGAAAAGPLVVSDSSSPATQTPKTGSSPPGTPGAAQRAQRSEESSSSGSRLTDSRHKGGVGAGAGVGGGAGKQGNGSHFSGSGHLQGKAVSDRDVRVVVHGVVPPVEVDGGSNGKGEADAAGGWRQLPGMKWLGGRGGAGGKADVEGAGKQRAGHLQLYALDDVQAERDRVRDMLDASGTQLLVPHSPDEQEEDDSQEADVEGSRPAVGGWGGQEGATFPIVCNHLRKRFDTPTGPRDAVRDLTLAIASGECFGLLGPNGAGKTSAIHMLTGLLSPSGGEAWVRGHRITTDMPEIYKLMGVCPQHDLLWEQLTAREHLRFYGRLKGLVGTELESAIDEALKGVNLYNVGNKFAGKYSGGMKRRLSVAISFIGSPQVVYLDEPSTGLDPASRRNLWDMVRNNKDKRAIILTTHSMQEAEMLCDRLGIFVDGQLVCIGTPKEITSRYAGFLVFTISVPAAQEQQARDLVLSMSPSAALTYSLGGTLKYELPTSEVTLSQVFAAVNRAKSHGGLEVIDWGVAHASLENVFIKLAKDMQLGMERMD